MSKPLTDEERAQHLARRHLHYIVALLELGPIPEGVRISLEAWAASLRQYLNIRARYAFVVQVPEPGELERLGLPLLEEGASGDE